MSDPTPRGDADADLSVLLITPDTFETIRRTVGCIARQDVAHRIELVILAPDGATIDVDAALVAPLLGVRVVYLPSLSPTGPARAAGIRAARAPVVVFAEEHCFPASGWASALLAAHADGDAVVSVAGRSAVPNVPSAVGPAIRNANPGTIVSWADLLIGYGPWLAPVARGDVEYLPGHNSSYKRDVLLAYGSRLDELMEAETVLMWDLRKKGHRLLLEPAAEAAHTNFGLWSSWVQVMFLNGRAFGHTRAAHWPLARRLAFAAASPLIPLVRLGRILSHVRRLGRGGGFSARVIPTVCIGLVFDALGQMAGYAAGPGHAHERLAEFEWHRFKHIPPGEAVAT